MKKTTLLLVSLVSFWASAQKVDLDRFYFNVNYQNLPKEVIPFNQRSFSTVIITDGPISVQFPTAKILNDKLSIYGWKKVDDNAALTVSLNLVDFYEEGSKIETRTVEEKDKDGKVIKSYPMYTIVTTYRGKGYAAVTAPASANVKPKEVVAEVAKANNRFMKSTSQTTEPAVVENNSKNFNFSEQYSYKTSENTNLAFLQKDVLTNRVANLNVRLREYVNNAISNTNQQLNYSYGFAPVSFQEQLWIMDSKEEEGTIQKEAIEAVKTLFLTMRADQPIDKLAVDLQPLIEYFESLKTKYTEDNKGSKKIRYSAYYNLGKIYLYLDQPEKVIKEGEGLIANDYDKKDGSGLISDAEKLIARFNATQLRTRHNPSFN